MGTQRIEIPWSPGKGQIIKQTGALNPGDVVEFFWRTNGPRDDPPFKEEWIKQNAMFACDVDPGNNCTITGEIKGPGYPVGKENGAIKSGSGQTSFSWALKKEFMPEPNSDYSCTVTITVDRCPGINGKLNAGPGHD